MVGGSGKDDIYGGWGNDLLNADDMLTTNGSLNDVPETHATFEDRAYGGAGVDILIGNTGGDRLIDWVGEWNSYLVPFAPFGIATVSRQVNPFLPEFLYALSASDGADPTRDTDTGSHITRPGRNGEYEGELGLIVQQDHQYWQQQTGAPSDPQPGNIPGGRRDTLRGADFNNGSTSGFAVDSGVWELSSGILGVSAASLGQDAAGVFYTDETLPVYYEISTLMMLGNAVGGWKSNAYVIFDYFSPTDFKFAGLDAATNKVVLGQRTASGWNVLAQSNKQMFANRSYDMLVVVDGLNVTVTVDGGSAATLQYNPRFVDGRAFGLNKGLVGLGADNARGSFDNFVVRTIPPSSAFAYEDDFADGQAQGLGAASGGWSVAGGRYSGSAASSPAISLVTTPSSVGYETYVELQARLTSTGIGGFVFDYYSDEDYKYVTIDPATGTLVIGHRHKKRWVADATVARPVSGDQLLQIGLRGTTVTVLQNGVEVASFAYNAGVVDGSVGFLSRSGSASYDDVKFMAGTQVTTSPDSTPPTLTAPGNLTRATDPGKATAFVSNTSIGTAFATDNLAGVVVTRSGVPTGNLFSIGVTEITWTATDVFGNTTVKTQKVTVSDLEKPTLTAPPNVVRAVSPGARRSWSRTRSSDRRWPPTTPAASPSRAAACRQATSSRSERRRSPTPRSMRRAT